MSAAVASAPAAPAPQSQPRSRDTLSSRPLELSARGYWLLALCVLGGYLVLWLTHFQYVYGWLADDFSWSWATGQAMLAGLAQFVSGRGIQQLAALFPAGAVLAAEAGNQSAILPAADAGRPDRSVPLPAAVCRRYARGRRWLPGRSWPRPLLPAGWSRWCRWSYWRRRRPSRCGAPSQSRGCSVCRSPVWGVWLLVRLAARSPSQPRRGAGYLMAGTLCGVAASIHYTSLYLLLPVCLVFWALRVWRERRPRRYGLDLLLFATGVLWLPALAEGISYFVIGLPFERGPLMGILALRNMHVSAWTLGGNLSVWAEILLGQMGLLLVAAIVLGG